MRGDDWALRLGVQNVLDSARPLTSPSIYQRQSYSTYGDAQGRRFQLTATHRF